MTAIVNPTKAQLQRLHQVSYGHLSRTGTRYYFYQMRNNTRPTWDMVDRLETNGWITWDDKGVAQLTEAGRAALPEKKETTS